MCKLVRTKARSWVWQGARVGACPGSKAVAVGPMLDYILQVKWMRVRVWGESLPPWSLCGGGSHYRLTVTVTSSDTLRLHSGELDGGQTMGCAKVVWTSYMRCIVLFFTLYTYIAMCVHV